MIKVSKSPYFGNKEQLYFLLDIWYLRVTYAYRDEDDEVSQQTNLKALYLGRVQC